MAPPMSASHPPREKSPSERPVPRKLKGSTVHPVAPPRRSASLGNEPSSPLADSGVAGNPWQMTRPGRAAPPAGDAGALLTWPLGLGPADWMVTPEPIDHEGSEGERQHQCTADIAVP